MLNTYCRRIAPILMILIPFITLAFLPIDRNISTVFWSLLFLNSLTFLINALLLRRGFARETEKKAREGFPIDSMEGYSVVQAFNSQVLLNSLLITISISLSFLFFLLAVYVLPLAVANLASNLSSIILAEALEKFIAPTILFSSLGLVLIAIGIWLLLKIPTKPAFQPGAMLKHYQPRMVPMSLDNFLSDALIPFLDPITRIKMDEWTLSIKNHLNPSFESHSPLNTRLERAKEKILLLFYLKRRMPEIYGGNTFNKELEEVIQVEYLPKFLEGESSGINEIILDEIFEKLYKLIPEVFETIDRIIIELVDNFGAFKENDDLWINISAPEKVIGNRDPFRILVFSLNKNSLKSKRKLEFIAEGPDRAYLDKKVMNLTLDDAEDLGIQVYSSLKFSSENEVDILTVLSKILQIGDAAWFSFTRNTFAKHLFSISIQEEGSCIYSRALTINVARDIKFYITEYGGRISALGGLAAPAIGFLLPILGL